MIPIAVCDDERVHGLRTREVILSHGGVQDPEVQLFETPDAPELGFCTYSIDRAMSYLCGEGMTGTVIRRTADGLPAVADLTDPATGKRIRLAARYSL